MTTPRGGSPALSGSNFVQYLFWFDAETEAQATKVESFARKSAHHVLVAGTRMSA